MESYKTLLVCRHGLSDANVQGHEAFGQSDALLTETGEQDSQQLGEVLRSEQFGVVTSAVASSRMTRAFQTARYAGFKHVEVYPTLDEVEHGCRSVKEWQEIKAHRILQQAALAQAAVALENYFIAPDSARDLTLPSEPIWFTHGYRAAHIEAVATDKGYVVQRTRTIPTTRPLDAFILDHCEIMSISR